MTNFMMLLIMIFQSTLPRGSDIITQLSSFFTSDFNPRSLAGATHVRRLHGAYDSNFNPRSLAGATEIFQVTALFTSISIHAPSRERHHAGSSVRLKKYFNPRSLAGATMCADCMELMIPISIHAPSRERPHERI